MEPRVGLGFARIGSDAPASRRRGVDARGFGVDGVSVTNVRQSRGSVAVERETKLAREARPASRTCECRVYRADSMLGWISQCRGRGRGVCSRRESRWRRGSSPCCRMTNITGALDPARARITEHDSSYREIHAFESLENNYYRCDNHSANAYIDLHRPINASEPSVDTTYLGE
jgi:hypothetical protein